MGLDLREDTLRHHNHRGRLSITGFDTMRIPQRHETTQAPQTRRWSDFFLIALLCCTPKGAEAKPAVCSTTDDGPEYACEFRPLYENGSFEISAPDKPGLPPTYRLVLQSASTPVTLSGYVYYRDTETGKINMKQGIYIGEFRRSRRKEGVERGCWERTTPTQVEICAR